MRRIARHLVASSAAIAAFSCLGGVSAHPAPAPTMRWSLDVKSVPGVSGSTDGAKKEEFRIIKLPGADEAFGGYFELGFRGIQVGESSDRPCGLRLSTESLERNGAAAASSYRGCAKGDVGDWRVAMLPEGAFVRSVASAAGVSMRVIDRDSHSAAYAKSWDAIEAYLSVVSNRMNEIMKVLTIFSAVMLPLTFIAGVYGMNFDNMPELHSRYGYFGALIVMGVVALGMLIFFWRRGWLGGGGGPETP